MKSAALAALAAVSFAGCATTGNPREGGLFGWSESKARERVVERRAAIDSADVELARTQRQSAEISSRERTLSREEAATARQRDRANAEVAERESAVIAKAVKLEAESPTPASASRAYRLRIAAETAQRDPQLSPGARARELRRIEIEIDQARAALPR